MLPRLHAALLGLALSSCGARSGLEVSSNPRSDVGRLDAGPDAGLDAAPRRDTGLDTRIEPSCPFGFDDTVPATLLVSTDDQARVFLHGMLLDDTARVWSDVAVYDIALFRHPSHANVLAIEGTNVFRIDGRDRGVLADLGVTTEAGPQMLITDGAWRLTTTFEAGFFDVEHDESGWRAPTLEGAHPIGPWGAIFGTSDAVWLWSYDSNVPATSKPEREVVFLRRRFFVDREGRIVDAPTPCP